MKNDKTSHWNYRVMSHFDADMDEHYFEIHEVYYNDLEEVINWGEESSCPFGEDASSLQKTVKMMNDAFNKPVLDYETGKEIISND